LTDEVTVGIPRTARASRSASIWKFVAPINLALLAFVLFFAGLRLARPRTVFYYTEGPVLGSLAALEASGDVTSLYPADGWTDPPTVLTLYPPVYFVLAAAIDQGAGTAGTLFGLRLLSAAALAGVVGLLTWQGIRRRVPASWLLAIGASALLTPGVYSVVAGAQPDSLALLWSWAGIWAALRLVESPSDGAGRVPWLVAGVTFLLAFFTKQSFIAAPVAFTIALFLARRRRAALTFAAVFAVAALGGVALLDQVSAGGFLANTVGALTGSTGLANLRSTLAESGPAQWTLLALVVGVAVTGRLRPGFPELYLLGSAALHTTAMLKTGSSVNYLLEPTFALLLLAIVRSPAREPGAGAAKPATSPFLAPGLAIGDGTRVDGIRYGCPRVRIPGTSSDGCILLSGRAGARRTSMAERSVRLRSAGGNGAVGPGSAGRRSGCQARTVRAHARASGSRSRACRRRIEGARDGLLLAFQARVGRPESGLPSRRGRAGVRMASRGG
jgi:hypothetical protein